MDEQRISDILNKFKAGELSEADTVSQLKKMPYEELGFAKIDHHRAVRQGFPEVVFCQGKTTPQVVEIVKRLAVHNKNILATRAGRDVYEEVKKIVPEAIYSDAARLIYLYQDKKPVNEDKFVLVMTAGTSDIPVAEEAALTAEVMGNRVVRVFDVGVAGIHRLLAQHDLIMQANVIIVVAGMEGALASVVGGMADKPIIAVPTSVGYGANFHGLSALLCMLNSCAAGVAVVNIDNGFGAGRLASIINQLGD